MPALPLSREEIARLTLDPDPERRWRQLQLAEVDALILVLEALEGLRQPSAQTIYFDENRVETWWEAGAFALVRDRIALLVRVSEQLALAEAAVAEATGAEQTAANQPQWTTAFPVVCRYLSQSMRRRCADANREWEPNKLDRSCRLTVAAGSTGWLPRAPRRLPARG